MVVLLADCDTRYAAADIAEIEFSIIVTRSAIQHLRSILDCSCVNARNRSAARDLVALLNARLQAQEDKLRAVVA